MFQEIKVSCKNGYSDAVGDNGKSGIRCTSTGYTGYIRRCVGWFLCFSLFQFLNMDFIVIVNVFVER